MTASFQMTHSTPLDRAFSPPLTMSGKSWWCDSKLRGYYLKCTLRHVPGRFRPGLFDEQKASRGFSLGMRLHGDGGSGRTLCSNSSRDSAEHCMYSILLQSHAQSLAGLVLRKVCLSQPSWASGEWQSEEREWKVYGFSWEVLIFDDFADLTILPMILAGRYWNSRFQPIILWCVLSIWRKQYWFYAVFSRRR